MSAMSEHPFIDPDLYDLGRKQDLARLREDTWQGVTMVAGEPLASPHIMAGLLDRLTAAETVLRRLVAPCPQCHTLGDNPNCTATIHTLPKEAKDDIRAVLDGR